MLRVRVPLLSEVAGGTIVSATATATGSSTARAFGKVIGGGASVPTKFARWASYQRRPGTFIRQVSPGVYLRASKTEAPVVVVNEREIGPAEDVRGERLAAMLAQGLDKRDARKIRKILRRLDEPTPEPVKSAEAEKLIAEVNASMPKRVLVVADSVDEEILALVALGII